MASSRIFQLSSAFFRLRLRSNPVAPPLPLYSRKRTLLPNRSPFAGIQRIQFLSATSATVEDAEVVTTAHPWPEWTEFVEKIRSKGYFDAAPSGDVDVDGEAFPEETLPAFGSSLTSVDTNKLKNACLKFARERFDILRALPKEDIRAVVECGCPNLFRKSVNSAKRLRAFLWIDEADACGACNIRGSCDKAYVVSHEEEGARTLDIMRVLLSYASNPYSLLGGENSPVKIQIQESARKLLSEIIKLSDTIIDPTLLKSIPTIPSQRRPSSQQKINMSRDKDDQEVEMKRGDWLCPNCNFLNFSRNVRCLECKFNGPKRVDTSAKEMKPGDWTCSKCAFMNFARNKKCFRCLDSRPKRDLNPGDWECPECDFLNFSRNEVCRKCNRDRPGNASQSRVGRKSREFKFGSSEDERNESEDDDGPRNGDKWRPTSSPKPKLGLKPGDWECPKCSFLNFSRNDACRKCNRDRPGDGGMMRKGQKSREFKFRSSEDEINDSEDEGRDKWRPSSPVKRKFPSSKRREAV